MKTTAIFLKEITTSNVLKASGNVIFDDELSLSFLVLEGKKGPFITWNGTEKYEKKDGTQGYSSPIFFKKEEQRNAVQKEIVNKYSLEIASKASNNQNSGAGFTSDEIPF